MRTGKSQFFRGLKIQVGTICRRQCQRLTEVMIEIIVHLVSPLFLSTAEHIDIIPRLRPSSNDTHHTRLVCPALRFTEIKIAVSDGRKPLARFRRSRKTRKQLKRMIAFHHRIARYTIHTYCIMTGELGIILRIIQPAIQE